MSKLQLLVKMASIPLVETSNPRSTHTSQILPLGVSYGSLEQWTFIAWTQILTRLLKYNCSKVPYVNLLVSKMTKCQLTGSADCEYKNTMDSLEQGTGVIYEFKKSIIDPAEARSRRLESIKHIATSLVKINQNISLCDSS